MTIEFTGTQGLEIYDTGNFDMSIFGITNPDAEASDGDIRIAIWAVEDPEGFENFLIWYYELASIDVPDADVLEPGETESYMTFSGTILEPVFDGLYSLAIVLLDDDGEGDPIILDYQIDDDTLLIGPPPPVSGLQKGTADNDELSGLNTVDTIYGYDGDDRLYGAGKNDSLFGGRGEDDLSGMSGSDLLLGGAGNDRLYGGSGSDTIRGQKGKDDLYGGGHDDTLYGGDGEDWLGGSAGDDRLYGNAQRDGLDGGRGQDQLFGGNGADTLTGGADGDLLHGGNGTDTVTYATAGRGLVVSLLDPTLNTKEASGDSFVSIENLTGTEYADTLAGNNVGNHIYGDFGADLIRGHKGHDWIEGGEGKDTLLGQAGRDTLDGGLGADVLRGGTGADTLSGSLGRDTFLFKRADLDGTADRITDFEDGDRIDLSDLDLDWIGRGKFSGTAGELRYAQDPLGYGNGRAVADLDGDGAADLTIWVDGFFTEIDKSDFIL